MRKNLFWFCLALLFVVSCSGGDEPGLLCVTVVDCPDASYSCVDGECVPASAEISDSDADNSGNSSQNDGENQEISGDSDTNGGNNSDSENGGDSELPDPVKDDNDEGGDTDHNQDADETSDTDNTEENDSDSAPADGDADQDGENSDTENSDADGDSVPSDGENSDNDTDTDTEENPSGEVTDCTEDTVCKENLNNIYCDTASGKCVMCVTDAHCLGAYGQSCDLTTHQCVSDKTCAAAIEKLPHGGKFDWEDGTTQEFSTNAYWNLVSSSLLPAEVEPVLTHGGNYSFGQYSGYSELMDYTSVLESVSDLSACSQCVVKAHFYARGQVENDSSSRDFIHPTCNGVGQFEAKNSKVSTQSFDPESPWEKARFDNGQGFEVKYNSYSTQKWTELDWTIPEACKTDQFVFGLRFTSSFMVNKNGLVVDDLTIAPAATEYVPNGEFESADGGNVKGWACDLDANLKNVLVKIEYYKNKDESAAAAVRWAYAKLQRPGDAELETKCSSTFNHGFEMPFDAALKTALGEGAHSAAVFAVDIPATENNCSGTYTKLGDAKEFTIAEDAK